MLLYERLLSLQRKNRSLAATIEVLSDEDEMRGLLAGIKDVREGRTHKLSEIRKSLTTGADGSSSHLNRQDP